MYEKKILRGFYMSVSIVGISHAFSLILGCKNYYPHFAT